MTPANAITFCRYILKETTASFWTDAELYVYMTEAEKEIMGLIIEEDEGYFQTTNETIDYVNGTQEYDLPSGIWKIVLVERTDVDPDKTLHPIRMQDKLHYEPASSTQATDEDYEYYYLSGTKIGIVPKPDENKTNNLKIYYIAEPSAVNSNSTAFTAPLFTHELICIKTIKKAKLKADEPVNDIATEEARLEARLKTVLVSRQTQEAHYVNYQRDAGYDY